MITNFRIVKYSGGHTLSDPDNDRPEFGIHEVGYQNDGQTPSDLIQPAILCGNTVEDIRDQVAQLVAAAARPVLRETPFKDLVDIDVRLHSDEFREALLVLFNREKQKSSEMSRALRFLLVSPKVKALRPRDADILRMASEEMKYREIAARLDPPITPARVREIYTRALRRLRWLFWPEREMLDDQKPPSVT